VLHRLQFARADRSIRRQVDRVEQWLMGAAEPPLGQAPVLFFNASTRIHHLSLNAAYSLLASWGIRAEEIPVRYLVCQAGLQQCVLGTDWRDPGKPPPCDRCTAYSAGLFPARWTLPLEQGAEAIAAASHALQDADLETMAQWTYRELPLGQLCLPGLRWALRRHHLDDDAATRSLLRQYLCSAASLAVQVDQILERLGPRAMVVFNGLMYPEAVARFVGRRRGVPVITHEVGLRPYTAFFSHKEATFREVVLPEGYRLDELQRQALEGELAARREGRFSMAGIRFWPQMQGLPEHVQSGLDGHRQTVAVFTNVVFDTSQLHANTLYPDQFAWLEDLGVAIRAHPETLFVIRAHPDEDRPGKASRESVAQWVRDRSLDARENVRFIPPGEYVSSYELIERSKFVLVYNSSIGLEASIMGAPVLCAGRARYTQTDAAELPASAAAYRRQLEAWLTAPTIPVPPGRSENARAFLYYELQHASLDLSEFLRPYPVVPGMVTFRDFEPQRIRESAALRIVADGVLRGHPFVLEPVVQA
jgi:hypothetical protein